MKTTYKMTTTQSLSPKRLQICVWIREMAQQTRLTAIWRATTDLLEERVER